jgi:hypothetical protein
MKADTGHYACIGDERLVINLGIAKAFGIKVPLTLQVAADSRSDLVMSLCDHRCNATLCFLTQAPLGYLRPAGNGYSLRPARRLSLRR